MSTIGRAGPRERRPQPSPSNPAPTRRDQSPPAKADDDPAAAAFRSTLPVAPPVTKAWAASVGRTTAETVRGRDPSSTVDEVIRPVPKTRLSEKTGPHACASRARVLPVTEPRALRLAHREAARRDR